MYYEPLTYEEKLNKSLKEIEQKLSQDSSSMDQEERYRLCDKRIKIKKALRDIPKVIYLSDYMAGR